MVARLKTTRKVVTESMRHGLSFESVAAAAFVKVCYIMRHFPNFSTLIREFRDKKIYETKCLTVTLPGENLSVPSPNKRGGQSINLILTTICMIYI